MERKTEYFYPHTCDDVCDILEKVPEGEISSYGFDGIEDQEELLDMVNQEYTITENEK